MIDLEQLKPILAKLTEGREDEADMIDAVAALDVLSPATDEEAIAAAVAEATAEIEAKMAQMAVDFNERYRKAFYDGVLDEIEVAAVNPEEPAAEVINSEALGEANPEITLAELLLADEIKED